MKPNEVAAAIRSAIENPTTPVDPEALRALADLAAEYLGARDRSVRPDAELGAGTRSLRTTEAALRQALRGVSGRPPEPDWSSMPGVAMRPDCSSTDAELRLVPSGPPAGAEDRVLAKVLAQARAEQAVYTAREALRAHFGYDSADPLAVATLAAGILTAESHAELLAVQERISAQYAEQIAIQRKALADEFGGDW